jgi:hypothetical protein
MTKLRFYFRNNIVIPKVLSPFFIPKRKHTFFLSCCQFSFDLRILVIQIILKIFKIISSFLRLIASILILFFSPFNGDPLLSSALASTFFYQHHQLLSTLTSTLFSTQLRFSLSTRLQPQPVFSQCNFSLNRLLLMRL